MQAGLREGHMSCGGEHVSPGREERVVEELTKEGKGRDSTWWKRGGTSPLCHNGKQMV